MNSISLTLNAGETLLDRLLREGVDIAHDCGGVLACSSCRVSIREGLERVGPASQDELDLLDRAEALTPDARLACQVSGGGELVLDIPRNEVPTRTAVRPLSLTERAARHFAVQLEKCPGALAVRLAAVASGCSGFRYRVDPAYSLHADDRVFESRGIRIVVDASSLHYVHGTTLDVVEEGLARRVRFDNPNARQNCGCGESFGV
jgi:iron-sulfur cluster assembly accessory protein